MTIYPLVIKIITSFWSNAKVQQGRSKCDSCLCKFNHK